VEYLELRNRQRQHPGWPAQDLYVTFRKALEPDESLRLQSIPRKQRAMVRKGQHHGLQSDIDADLQHFFPLYANCMRRHGTPALSRRYFQALLDVFGADCEVLTVASATGQPLRSVLSFYFRNEVLPYYAGDTPAARAVAANDFKYWALMGHASGRGAQVFDYGRSKQGACTPVCVRSGCFRCTSAPRATSLWPCAVRWSRANGGLAPTSRRCRARICVPFCRTSDSACPTTKPCLRGWASIPPACIAALT
jgi:hypothetical protein